MPAAFTESVVEEAVLGWLGEMGYTVAAGPDLAPEGANPERATFADVVLVGRLRAALAKINPTIPPDAIEEAVRKVTHADTPSLIENNRRLHALLTDGVDVEVRRDDGSVGGDKVWLIDFAAPDANDFLAVNQFTVTEDRHTRRMDVVVFVNGLPLAVLELKNPTAESPK
jgi:type I restriction enzyme R subunit